MEGGRVGGRDRWRKGVWEGGKDEWTDRWMDEWREGGREGGREGDTEGGMDQLISAVFDQANFTHPSQSNSANY